MTSVLRSKLPRSNDERQDAPDRKSGERSRSDSQDSKRSGDAKLVKSSHIIAEQIEVGVPRRTAYDQWTQYDKWSEMFKAESAKPGENGDEGRGRGNGRSRGNDSGDNDDVVTVSSKIGPSRRQWDTEIVEVIPGRRLAWRAKGGAQAKGVTTFHQLDDNLTQLMVQVEYKPTGFMETVGNFFRMQRRRVRKDLKLFKNYIELLEDPTGFGPSRRKGEGLREDMDRQAGHQDQNGQEEEG